VEEENLFVLFVRDHQEDMILKIKNVFARRADGKDLKNALRELK